MEDTPQWGHKATTRVDVDDRGHEYSGDIVENEFGRRETQGTTKNANEYHDSYRVDTSDTARGSGGRRIGPGESGGRVERDHRGQRCTSDYTSRATSHSAREIRYRLTDTCTRGDSLTTQIRQIEEEDDE